MTIQQNIDAFFQAAGALVKTIQATQEPDIETALALTGKAFVLTQSQFDALVSASQLVPGRQYYITDQQIYRDALTGNTWRDRLLSDLAGTAVVADVQVQPDGDSLRLQLIVQLLGDETSDGRFLVYRSLQLATSSQPGLMPAASFNQIQTNAAAIAALESATVNIPISTASIPGIGREASPWEVESGTNDTAAEGIPAFVSSESFSPLRADIVARITFLENLLLKEQPVLLIDSAAGQGLVDLSLMRQQFDIHGTPEFDGNGFAQFGRVSGNYILIPDTSGLLNTDGDWTLEFVAQAIGTPSTATDAYVFGSTRIMSADPNPMWIAYAMQSNNTQSAFTLRVGVTYNMVNQPSTLPDMYQPQHIAYVKTNGRCTLYVAGQARQQNIALDYNTDFSKDSPAGLGIVLGTDPTQGTAKGDMRLARLRFTRKAIYAGTSFTPPANFL
jgi:hypothetical protein